MIGTGREDGTAGRTASMDLAVDQAWVPSSGESRSLPPTMGRRRKGAMARTEPPDSPKVAKADQLALVGEMGGSASCMREKDMSC